MTTGIRVAPALLVLALGTANIAAADPIRITGGQVELHGFGGTVLLAGERRFTLSARVSVTDGVFSPHLQCLLPECRPGVPIALEAVWIGLSLRDGIATLDGEAFPGVGGLTSPNSAALRFGGSVIAPPFAGDTAQVSSPFTFQGQFTHRGPSGFTIVEPLFGQGMATLHLRRSGDGLAWQYTDAFYVFDPVPEPATMLLAGAGLAVIARRGRRASRRRGPASAPLPRAAPPNA